MYLDSSNKLVIGGISTIKGTYYYFDYNGTLCLGPCDIYDYETDTEYWIMSTESGIIKKDGWYKLALSNDVYDFIVSSDERNTPLVEPLCIQEINRTYSILYYDRSRVPPLSISDYSYTAIPKLFSLMDSTSLDVSGATVLTTLYCGSNQLTSLDVSGATALTR